MTKASEYSFKKSTDSLQKSSKSSQYWIVHGEHYDLTEFVDRHPGGDVILVGKGRDCTELFESVHVLSETNVRAILAKYKVTEPCTEIDTFSWNKGDFYDVVSQRVRAKFAGRDHKATTFVFCKILVMLAFYAFCWWKAVSTANFWFAIASGAITEMIGFCAMHDGSHSALSKRPFINHLGHLWAPWMFWNHWLWLQHHVYGHHSYTGIYGKDPDIANSSALCRKHERIPSGWGTWFQHYHVWFILAPFQHAGQALLYQLKFLLKNRLFGMPVTPVPGKHDIMAALVMALSFYFHIIWPLRYQPFYVIVGLFLTQLACMGISYFAHVAPNHDQEDTVKNHPTNATKKIDWGEQQVRCTGNHSCGNSFVDQIITQFWGGMNFQIEHHLFPTMCHCWYPEISSIVKTTCKEFDLPYDDEKSWVDAMSSFYQMMKKLAVSNKKMS